jgi:uncharacterized membrane protein
MWFENPLFWWLLLTAFVLLVITVLFIRRKPEKERFKKQLDHFCRCYARGEISLEDFRELKHDLQEFEKKNTRKKQQTSEPLM